jgi:transcriptional regulator with XRE-family HTH domain
MAVMVAPRVVEVEGRPVRPENLKEALRKVIGKHLRAIREELDKTTAEMAELLLTNLDTYGSWERGRRLIPLDKLYLACVVSGRPLAYFVGQPDPASLTDKQREAASLIETIKTPRLQENWLNQGRGFVDIEREMNPLGA